MRKLTAVLVLFLVLPLNSLAASLIESRDAQGRESRIYVEADRARLEVPQQSGYMILDAGNNTLKAVMRDQGTVLDMSSLLENDTATDTAGQVKSRLKNKGDGPAIAGYSTREYALYTDGNYCGSAFVSLDIMKDLDLQRLAGAMQTASSQIQKRMAGMNMNRLLSPCEHARKDLGGQFDALGFPLRLTGSDRTIISEVTRVDTSATLPANAFVIPADYRVIKPDEMMQDAMKKMPQMKEMIRNMSPEALDAMRKRMQEMYQQ